jgi:hypothetical protein
VTNTETSSSPRFEELENVDRLVGKRVHELVWDRRLTNKSVAPQLGMDPSGFSRRLRGERGWSTSELLRVAMFFGVTVGYLFGEEEGPAPISGQGKGPAGGAARPSLPELDSNQQPAGFELGILTHGRFGERTDADGRSRGVAVVTPFLSRQAS